MNNLTQITAIVEKIMSSTVVAGRQDMRHMVEQTVELSVKTLFHQRRRDARTPLDECVFWNDMKDNWEGGRERERERERENLLNFEFLISARPLARQERTQEDKDSQAPTSC
jgi:hypothetical protein